MSTEWIGATLALVGLAGAALQTGAYKVMERMGHDLSRPAGPIGCGFALAWIGFIVAGALVTFGAPR